MAFKNRSTVEEEGVGRSSGTKKIPRTGLQAVAFEEGITFMTSNKLGAEEWCGIGFRYKIAEGNDEGLEWYRGQTICNKSKGDTFVDRTDKLVADYLVIAGCDPEKFYNELLEDGHDVGESYFLVLDEDSLPIDEIDYNKAEAVVRKLKAYLPGKVFHAIIDHEEDKTDNEATFYRPVITYYAKYGSEEIKKYDTGKSVATGSANSSPASSGTSSKQWG